MAKRLATDLVVAEVVTEFRELVNDKVTRIAPQLTAGIVYLLDVAFRAWRSDDVIGVINLSFQPVKALATHVLRQNRHTAALHQARDGNTAAGIVAGRGPHCPVTRRIKLATDDTRYQTSVSGKYLVATNHRKTVTQDQHNPCIDAGQLFRQNDVLGYSDSPGVIHGVIPVQSKEV